MKFEVGHIYTHKRMLDVCMLITDIYYCGGIMTVRWFKKNGLDLNATDSIRTDLIKAENWYEVADGET